MKYWNLIKNQIDESSSIAEIFNKLYKIVKGFYVIYFKAAYQIAKKFKNQKNYAIKIFTTLSLRYSI